MPLQSAQPPMLMIEEERRVPDVVQTEGQQRRARPGRRRRPRPAAFALITSFAVFSMKSPIGGQTKASTTPRAMAANAVTIGTNRLPAKKARYGGSLIRKNRLNSRPAMMPMRMPPKSWCPASAGRGRRRSRSRAPWRRRRWSRSSRGSRPWRPALPRRRSWPGPGRPRSRRSAAAQRRSVLRSPGGSAGTHTPAWRRFPRRPGHRRPSRQSAAGGHPVDGADPQVLARCWNPPMKAPPTPSRMPATGRTETGSISDFPIFCRNPNARLKRLAFAGGAGAPSSS